MSRLALVLALFVLSLPALGQPANDPEGRYKQALSFRNLGNDDKAAQYFEHAANEGHALAQYELGVSLAHGRGVKRNLATAHKWLEKAAMQGVGIAAYHRGMLDNDHWMALAWFEKAYALGNDEGTIELARMLMLGDKVPRNIEYAKKALRGPAAKKIAEAQRLLGVAYCLGDTTTCSEGAIWVRRAADQGDAQSQSFLGYLYSIGKGVPQSLKESTAWYRKAAAQGNEKAQLRLKEIEDQRRAAGALFDSMYAEAQSDLSSKRKQRTQRRKDDESSGAELLVAGLALLALFGSDDREGSQAESGDDVQWCAAARKRIVTCNVTLCPTDRCEYEVDCGQNFLNNGCERRLANYSGLSWGTYYCDEEDSWNYDRNWARVAHKICK